MQPDSPPAPIPSPTSWFLLRVWLALGLQSFGGGAATLTLIRRAVVERHGWLSDAEFVREWAICQIAPGINLLAMTILIGRRTAGARGIALALLGLLLPSVTITIVATAFYARFRDAPAVRAALRGVLPATVGLGLLTALQLARPLFRDSRSEGRASLLVSGVIFVGSAVAFAIWHPSVLLVLFAGGLVGAVWTWRRHLGDGEGSAA